MKMAILVVYGFHRFFFSYMAASVAVGNSTQCQCAYVCVWRTCSVRMVKISSVAKWDFIQRWQTLLFAFISARFWPKSSQSKFQINFRSEMVSLEKCVQRCRVTHAGNTDECHVRCMSLSLLLRLPMCNFDSRRLL